ncbi:response regulator [Flavobacterium oreochromis]|uniref:Response regulator n=1 Tax=Flavobacterium columnare TaxID=996 RepID=A0A246G7N0_9FLAO|nr:response regulator [Flavobacterium oreochromis]OWP74551.1 response regulator [Flavobacterium oreochromis]POR26114.1 response regulator [Flavobacterium columnare]
MFKKVLVVDDIDLNNIATEQALKELNIPSVEYVKYCDEALLKFKKAQNENAPYDLLITDLSFKADHREAKLNSGEQLIAEIKKSFPLTKIIAFSIDDRPHRIKRLMNEQNIEAYVLKHRNTANELLTAINKIWEGKEKYLSPSLQLVLQDKSTAEIDDYDIQLLTQLALGIPQENMEAKFKQLGISPNSKSTIEKRIAKLKDYFQANNTIHLVAIAKDMGIV